MNLKYIARVGVTIIIILALIGILYYGMYLPYKWDLTGVVADANGVPVKDADVKFIMVGGEAGGEKATEGEGEKGASGVLSTKTDDTGGYKFSSNILKQIQPGIYSINVTTMLPNGQPYTGYSGMIQLTGRNIKQNLVWIRSDEVEILAQYDEGLSFVAKQTRPDESKPGSSASGVFWVKVDLTALGSDYGIQIENSPGNNVSINLMKGDLILRPGKEDINDSKVVDVDSRINGKYPEFLNTVVFAGLESAKLRESAYRLTANQREVIFAPITTGVFARDVYDDKGNWAGRSNYSDMTLMSQEYFDQYFEIVKTKVEAGQTRIEYRCKDNKAVWDTFKASCVVTQHCDNVVAKNNGQECSKGNL